MGFNTYPYRQAQSKALTKLLQLPDIVQRDCLEEGALRGRSARYNCLTFAFCGQCAEACLRPRSRSTPFVRDEEPESGQLCSSVSEVCTRDSRMLIVGKESRLTTTRFTLYYALIHTGLYNLIQPLLLILCVMCSVYCT